MQAAPVSVLRTLVASGHESKLIVAFTHFDEVKGDNLINPEAKKDQVIGSYFNAVPAIGHLRSHLLDGLAHTGDLVTRQIVHHDQITPTECGNQVLFHPGSKDGTAHDQRSRQSTHAKRRQERPRGRAAHDRQDVLLLAHGHEGASCSSSPMSHRERQVDWGPDPSARLAAGHVVPPHPDGSALRPSRLFLNVSFSRCSARQSVVTLSDVCNRAFSSERVRSGDCWIAARIRSASAIQIGLRRRVVNGAVFPISRRTYLLRLTHDSLTPNRLATSVVLRPVSHAASTSRRNSFEKDFMAPSGHEFTHLSRFALH